MQEKIYISERQEGFKAHQSLTDKPLVFETSGVKGAIFYLPFEQPLGGDSFVVKMDNYLTVSLLEDVQGHGTEGRNLLNHYIYNLEKIANSATKNEFKREAFAEEIKKLDIKLAPSSKSIAFSLIRILPEGTIQYLNEGENIFIYSRNKQIFPLKIISHGEIGYYDLTLGNRNKIIKKLIPYQDKLKSGDKILICSDGVKQYMNEKTYDDELARIEEIKQNLLLNIDIGQTISRINMSAEIKLKEKGETKIIDDYTIIGLQLK